MNLQLLNVLLDQKLGKDDFLEWLYINFLVVSDKKKKLKKRRFYINDSLNDW